MQKAIWWSLLVAFSLTIVYFTFGLYYLKKGDAKVSPLQQAQITNQELSQVSSFFEEAKRKTQKIRIAPFQNRSYIKEITTPNFLEEKVVLFWFVPYENDRTVPLEYLLETNNVTISNFGKLIRVDSRLCGKCRLTFDRDLISKSDAVVFYVPDVNTRPSDLPHKASRQEKQLYIWWLLESTAGIPFRTKAVPDFFFNLTMSVRRSSGVHSPYSTLPWILKMLWNKKFGRDIVKIFAREKRVWLTRDLEKPIQSVPVDSYGTIYTNFRNVDSDIKPLLDKKKGLIAWIVSNCGNIPSSYLRFEYADRLRENGLKIDQFGACSDISFPIGNRWDPFFHEVLSTYKFYLAFENAYHCNGYMTEKLWYNALYSGAVPIIFGPHKDDVSAALPPKSYIHTEDFKNPADLVKYIYYLDKNVTAYVEYLEWRTWVKFLDQNGELSSNVETNEEFNLLSKEQRKTILKYLNPIPSGFCGLCRKLHDRHSSDTYTMKSVNDWWEGTVRRECMDVNLARSMTGLKENTQ